MSIKRQFIAGARCPECGAVDKIQRCQEGEHTWMECLSCAMQRDMDDEPKEAREPEPPATEQAVIWKPLK